MNFFTRAGLHLTRKLGKTFLLSFIFITISTLLLSCIAIFTSTQNKTVEIRQILPTSLTINAKQLKNGIDNNVIQSIDKIENTKSDYVLRSYTKSRSYFKNRKPCLLEENEFPLLKDEVNTSKLIGSSDSKKDTYFTEAGFVNVQGKHINRDSKGEILIHEIFAKNNFLKIGDSLNIQQPNSDELIPVKIVGIFTNEKEQETNTMMPSYDLYQNIMFVDITTISQLLYRDNKIHAQFIDIPIKDPEYIDNTIKDIRKIQNVDWNNTIITKNDSVYLHSKEALNQTNNTLVLSFITILFISMVLLILILRFWIINRKKEIGIYLSMGITKKSIILQFSTEVFIITIISIFIAYFMSCAIAQTISNSLIQTNIESLPVTISIKDWALTSLVSITLSVFTTLISSTILMRFKPKEILSSTE